MHMNLGFYKKLYENPKLYWNSQEWEKKNQIAHVLIGL